MQNNALTKIDDNKFKFNSIGLSIAGSPSIEEWKDCGKFLKQADKAVQMWIGDWLNYGELKWKETYIQAAIETGYELQTLRNYKYVASSVDSSRRRDKLEFSHYAEVAKLPPQQQEKLLDKAEKEELSVRDLRREVQSIVNHKKTVELPSGKYRVIYADPPWQYSSGDQHSNEQQETVLGTHYPSMSIQELCNLPIKDMAMDDSVLFMWVTSPLLAECFDVIKAWGFQYKASIVWNKDAHNVGHYVSVRHEFLLICTRGSCLPDTDKLYPSVITEKRTEHSKKPEIFRNMIDAMYPIGKRVELFARTETKGWEVWSNEL